MTPCILHWNEIRTHIEGEVVLKMMCSMQLEYCMTNWSVSLSVTISKDQRWLNNTYQLFQVDGYVFFQPPFENGGRWINTLDLPMCLADMLFNSSPPGGTISGSTLLRNRRPSFLRLFIQARSCWIVMLDCCFRIHISIFDLLKFIHNISLTDTHYMYIYIYRVYLKNIFIHRHTTTHLHFSCHVRETPTYISNGEPMFSCNFDESQV